MIHSIFPSLIHVFEISFFPEVKDKIIKYVYKEKKKDPKGNIHSNRGGWQSHREYQADENILSTIIRTELINYFVKNKILNESTKLKFESMWININNKGDYNVLHVHPQCDLSGVLWLKIPKDSGNICFISPHFHSGWNEMNSYTGELLNTVGAFPTYYFNPIEGSIALFPSSLYHEVRPNESKQDRISTSFNISLFS